MKASCCLPVKASTMKEQSELVKAGHMFVLLTGHRFVAALFFCTPS